MQYVDITACNSLNNYKFNNNLWFSLKNYLLLQITKHIRIQTWMNI